MENKKKLPLSIGGLTCMRCHKNEYMLLIIDKLLWSICKECGTAAPLFPIPKIDKQLYKEMKEDMGLINNHPIKKERYMTGVS